MEQALLSAMDKAAVIHRAEKSSWGETRFINMFIYVTKDLLVPAL